MGQEFFGIDFQSVIAEAFPEDAMAPIILRKIINGVRTPEMATYGTNPTSAEYVCWGMVEDYRLASGPDRSQVQGGYKKVLIIAQPLEEAGVAPGINDELLVEGKVYVISGDVPDAVRRDPATATYTCVCRG